METLYVIGFVVLLIAITVVPVMIAARWAAARRAGFVHALMAVILATLVAQLALALTGNALLGLVLALVGACVPPGPRHVVRRGRRDRGGRGDPAGTDRDRTGGAWPADAAPGAGADLIPGGSDAAHREQARSYMNPATPSRMHL